MLLQVSLPAHVRPPACCKYWDGHSRLLLLSRVRPLHPWCVVWCVCQTQCDSGVHVPHRNNQCCSVTGTYAQSQLKTHHSSASLVTGSE